MSDWKSWGAILVFIIITIIFYWWEWKRNPKDTGNYRRNKGLAEEAGLLGDKGIRIGYLPYFSGKPKRPMFYNGDRHMVTFGPTGTGKNATSQTPVLLSTTSSALVIDVKGQLCAITALCRAQMGQKIAVINPFGVLGLPTECYNPLAFLNPFSLTFASDCRRIAEGLIDISKGDHWENSALDVVVLLIMWVVFFENQKDLPRIRQLLNLDDAARIELFSTMAACDNPLIAEGAARYTSDSREVRDCIQTAVVQLSFLRDKAVETVLSGKKQGISFAELKKRKMTIYLIIPPELLHTHGKLLRLFVMSALGELIKERTAPDEPVLFMLDEFAALGHMALIENAASIVRDYKIRLWIILQNIPQLKALYGQKWESFLSSAGIIQVFTPNDMETAEYFSKRSGIDVEYRKTYSPSGESSTEIERPKHKPSQLFNMHESIEHLNCAGMNENLYAWRLPYYKDSNYDKLYFPDPYHMDTKQLAAFEVLTKNGQWKLGIDKVTANPSRFKEIRYDDGAERHI